MKNYTVYVHIAPNGKRYYGITSQEVKNRWKNGNGYKNQEYFNRAIKKYGWDNFKHIIVAKGLDEETAKWLEIELIREWDTTNREKGYNITKGGESTNGWIPSEKTRKKMSENNARYWKDKQFSEEQRRKISENHASMKGEDNPMYGKNYRDYMSEEKKIEHDKKISEANKGKNNPAALSVICITTSKIFYTTREGAKYYNCQPTSITHCSRGKYKSAGKLPNGDKLVWMYLDKFLEKCKYIDL